MIRYFTAHPTAANLLMIGLLGMGVFAVPRLKRETFPDFSMDQVEIRVLYPGAAAEDVESGVCLPLEDAIDGVSFIKEIVSEARENLGTVIVEMEEGGDIRTFLDDIRTEVEAARDELPEEAEDPIVTELNRTDQVVSVAVAGPMSVPDLKDYCEEIKTRLQRLDGVSLVEVAGFSDRQIRIEIPSVHLMQYGLSPSDLARAIERQSLDLPAGTLENTDRDFSIRFTDERADVRAFENLTVLGGERGGEIRLGEIATVTESFEREEEKILLNGRRAGLLRVTKNKSEDTLTVYDQVERFVRNARATAPSTVEFALTANISSIVRDRLQMLTRNAFQGLTLVFLVMWLFFNVKISFWVVMGLPVSFLGAFFFFPMFGLSINMLTMVGLLLALGLLMDDAIVIAENVATHLGRDKPVFDAVVDGVGEVKMGVIASFTTTVCVFGPVSFLEGHLGKVLKVMPVVLILVLTVSLIEAFLILPRHLNHSMSKRRIGPPNRFRRRFDAGIEWVRSRLVGGLVDLTVRWRYLTMGLVVFVFFGALSLMAGGVIKFVAFPEIDGDVVEARILLNPGTPLERTEGVVDRILQAADRVNEEFRPRQPNGADLIQTTSVQFGRNIDAHEAGPHVATVTLDLLSAEVRDARNDDILNRWREETRSLTDTVFVKFTEPEVGPAGRPIDIRFKGADLDRLEAAALESQTWLNRYPGVLDLSDDLRPSKPEIRVRLKEGATALGLNAAMVAIQLRSAFFGQNAHDVWVGGEEYEVEVRLAEADRNDLADLDYFHVTLPGGGQVPLDSVAVLESNRSYARIARVDRERTVSVQGTVDVRRINTAELLGTFQREFLPDLLDRYPNTTVTFEGEIAESAVTQASMRRGFLIGILGIFILLSFQFRSFVEPIIVMVAIPFSLVGVVLGHLLMGLDLSMPSMMGFVSLAGVVVNDSILLVEFVKIARGKGEREADAARIASRDRFRAVTITTLTTVAGLLPLLAERSLQAQVLIPLATSIVFGLLASTILVLFVIPALYAILGDLNLTADVS